MLTNDDRKVVSFLDLLRVGLWEKDELITHHEKIDYRYIYQLSNEQAVIGLIAAGLDSCSVELQDSSRFDILGRTLQIEQCNIAMNQFVADLFKKLQSKKINAILVKGQGIAQCYERPLWRNNGDVDLLLDEDNYIKAVSYLSSFADSEDEEVASRLHYGFKIGPWVVELHGTLRGHLYNAIDCELDAVQNEMVSKKQYKVWNNDGVDILLPSPNNDVIIVFTHTLQHFSQVGVGLRQVCDLCRLLWVYHKEIDSSLLSERFSRMGLMTVWKTFGAMMVNHLGLPKESFPLYDDSARYKKKGDKVLQFILEVGNMGHNRDTSYTKKYPFVISKIISFGRETKDFVRHFTIFPSYSMKVWGNLVKYGIRSVIAR